MLPANEGLRLFDINWKCKTAGPSPNNNERIEVFLLGCEKAAKGNPCPGCFNSITWDASKAEFSWDPIELANKICNYTTERYITIGGGEPSDQINNLIPFVKELKKHNFHILMYTWQSIEYKDNKFIFPRATKDTKKSYDLLPNYVDIIIDGAFDPTQKLYINDSYDGLYGSVGSGNQCIWDMNKKIKVSMKELQGIKLTDDNELIYIYKEGDKLNEYDY